MSNTSFMKIFLKDSEVEWMALWQVTTWDKRFNAVAKEKQPKVINYQYLLAAELFDLEQDNGDIFLLSTGERTGWTTKELAGKYLHEGEIVTIPWGKSRPIKDVIKYYKGSFVTADNRIATSNDTNRLLNKFLYYWLMSQTKVLDSFYRGSGIQHPSMADVLDMKIPIPPFNVQAEIVRILDTFTELTAELTAELVARKQQYAYYRDQLLTFEEGEVDWKALGSLAENLDCKRKPITSGLRESGSIPYYGASGIVDYVKDYIFDGDYLLISEDGANLTARNTPIAFSISGKNWVNNHAHVLKFETYAERRYVEYYLNSIELTPYISGSAQPKLNQKNLNSIKIPSPSLKDQERIVAILDKFDTLTTSLTEGLPREIELRQQQYEYYRELLLSFPKAEVTDHD
ncbi:restriction endonuclease subunit S [Psychrobacter immobilis]|uniref:restriction endonuclease subunit S n=1 Tax=Psychrobacter immobilis TaxID=498 RepID=UPI001D128F1A|nr:restriction endonuclease subunit S [Psychrobacter immobilis]